MMYNLFTCVYFHSKITSETIDLVVTDSISNLNPWNKEEDEVNEISRFY